VSVGTNGHCALLGFDMLVDVGGVVQVSQARFACCRLKSLYNRRFEGCL
jgi:hypothetical protein